MRIPIDLQACIFATVDSGYLLPTVNIKAGTKLQLQSLPISCMFNVSLILIDTVKCGFHFTSRFTTDNHGACLVTYLQNKPLAESMEVLLKSPELVIYHAPNRGTLAISPSVSELVQSIFEDQ